MEFNVNTDAVVKFTNKLEKLHKSAFPVAVRVSLNSVAFDVKQRTLLKVSKFEFTNRSPNFFKANSRVEKANGFDLKSMKATIGFNHIQKNASQAVDDLEQQEHGGSIGGRSFIPLNTSRVASSQKKAVRTKNRVSEVQSIVNARKMSGSNKKQKFMKAVAKAGVGGFVLSELKIKGHRFVWRVNSLNRTSDGKLKLTGIFIYKKARKVDVDSQKFMQKASYLSHKRLEEFYIIEAEKQIKRLSQ
jgi:hypothetical protein